MVRSISGDTLVFVFFLFGISSGKDSHPFHELAGRLEGKLLMMHGMMNACTPVAVTFGFVQALLKANKQFDMLILPTLGHGVDDFNHYTVRRRWDYFVEHLLGKLPPKDFNLAGED